MSSFRVINDMLVPQDETVHGPFKPTKLGPQERINCYLMSDAEAPRQIWRISPFGLEIVVHANENFEVGTPIDLHVSIHDQNLSYRGIVVASGYVQEGVTLVGIRAQPQASHATKTFSENTELRTQVRWACSPLFYPTGVTHNPAKFEDPILFRIRDLSAGGMLFSTSMRNKHLVKGLKLKAIITCPTIGDTAVTFVIQHLHIEQEENKSQQLIGAQFEHLSQHARQLFGQYILQFATHPEKTPTLPTLRQDGFHHTELVAPIEFDLVKTPEQYQKVLQLRARSTGTQSTQLESTNNTFDFQDVRANIILGMYRQESIISARLAFHDAHANFEFETHMQVAKMLPKREQIAELTRICVHPDFQHADTHFRMISYAALFALQSKRRYLLLSIPRANLNMYKNFGFKSLHAEFKQSAQDAQDQMLGIIDLHARRQTQFLHPSVYDATVSDLGRITQSIDPSQLRLWTKIRFGLHRIWRLVRQ